MERFAEQLPKLRRRVAGDLTGDEPSRERVLACAVRLLDVGLFRIGGEEWSARSYDETLVIPVGITVDVMQIEGATALVYPRE